MDGSIQVCKAKFGLSDTGNLSNPRNCGASDQHDDAQRINLNVRNKQSGTGALNVNSGATTLGGNLNVSGTLTVTNSSEFNGTVDVDANFAVRSGTTDKFTVASSSGNVSTSEH